MKRITRVIGAPRHQIHFLSEVWLIVKVLKQDATSEFVMGKSPNPAWGTAAADAPPSYRPDCVTQ
jgi:putative alpha-1,2-mannosidase